MIETFDQVRFVLAVLMLVFYAMLVRSALKTGALKIRAKPSSFSVKVDDAFLPTFASWTLAAFFCVLVVIDTWP